jgi:hypothetical protein
MKRLIIGMVLLGCAVGSVRAGYVQDGNGNMIWYGQSGHWATYNGLDGTFGEGWRNRDGKFDWTLVVPEEGESDCGE